MSSLVYLGTDSALDVLTENLCEKLRPRVDRMAAYYARRCTLEADDLKQEAWLGVVEAVAQVDPSIGDSQQYLLRYARWRVLDIVRRSFQSHQTTIESVEVVGGQADDHHLSLVEIAEFLDALSENRRVLVEHLLAGFTWRETGDLLGCSSANVAYHVRQIGKQYLAWSGKSGADA